MVLIGLPPEFFVFGFVGTVMTHSPWFGPALVHALYFGIFAWTVHRCDVANGLAPTCEQSVFEIVGAQAIPTWAGVLVGVAYVWALDWPRLVVVEAFYSWPHNVVTLLGSVTTADNDTDGGGQHAVPHNPKTQIWTVALAAAAVAATATLYFIQGDYLPGASCDPRLSVESNTVLLIAGLFITLAFFVIYFASLCLRRALPDGNDQSELLNFKYIIYYSLVFILSAIYDFVPLAPFTRYGLQVVALLVITVLWFLFGAHLSEQWSGDRYLGSTPAVRVDWAFFVFFLIYATVYSAAPISHTSAVPSVELSFQWTLIFSAVWLVLLLIGGFVRRFVPNWRDVADQMVTHYRTAHLSKTTPSRSRAGVEIGGAARTRASLRGSSRERVAQMEM